MMGISAELVPKEIGQDYREATVRTQSPLLIRQHNDGTLGCVSPASPSPSPSHLLFSPYDSPPRSPLCLTFSDSSISLRQNIHWHLAGLTHLAVGEEFVIKPHLIGPPHPLLSFFFFSPLFFCLSSVLQEKTATSVNGSKAIESHKGNVGANPFWRIMKRKVTPANLWGAAVSLTCNYFLFTCQIFLSFLFFFWGGFQLNSSQGDGILSSLSFSFPSSSSCAT